MRKKPLYKISICVFVLFITIRVQAQANFGYKAALEEINATGFYKIDLPPMVVAKCKSGLEDLRIFDDAGKQVSYILKNDLPFFKNEYLTELPIIKIAKESDKQIHIILQNTSGKAINTLLLFIKNMDASRALSVTGSDDSSHWFIIKENIYLENTFSNDEDNTIKILSFPKSNYKYFQLTILGKNVVPFNIIRAGIYKEDVLYGKYLELPNPVISQKDSADKKSYVLLQFDHSYKINKIIIEATGAKYFKRNISVNEGYKGNFTYLMDNYLVSDSATSFILNCKTSLLQLIVNNEDNIPLTLKEIKAFQLNISLLTYLQANKKYCLYFGDSTAQFPKYDLQFFKDSVEKNPANLSINAIEKNYVLGNSSSQSYSKKSKEILWVIMIVILFVLSFFTFKMIREVDKKKERDQ